MTKTIKSLDYLLIFGFPIALFSFLFILTRSQYFLTAPDHFSTAVLLDLVVTGPLVMVFILHKKRISKIYVAPMIIGGVYLASYAIPEIHPNTQTLLKYVAIPLCEGFIVFTIIRKVFGTIKNLKHSAAGTEESLDFYDQLKGVMSAHFPQRIVSLATNEIATFYYLAISYKKRVLRSNEYSYKNGGGAIMSYTLLGVLLIELFTVHFLLNQWSPTAAWMLTAFSIYGILQILGMVAGIKHRPIILSDHHIVLRYSFLNETKISFDAIDKIEQTRKRVTKEEGYAPLSALGEMESQNLIIHLKDPHTLHKIYNLKTTYTALGLYVDDKERFCKELATIMNLSADKE